MVMSFLPSVHKFGSAEGSWELLYHNLRFPVQLFSFLWPTGQISLQFRQIRTGSGRIRCGLHKRNGLFHHLRDHLCHFFCGNARRIINANGVCIVSVLPYCKAHTAVVPLHGDFHIVALREIIVVIYGCAHSSRCTIFRRTSSRRSRRSRGAEYAIPQKSPRQSPAPAKCSLQRS